ncbi:MAG TPA: redoxin domain-containing protein [Chitinophagaceae bacterium]
MQKLIAAIIGLLLSAVINAQADPASTPPYKRFPSVPPFKLLKTDSVSVFTKADLKKNRPVLVILFSPECDHCKHETEEIIRRIDDFKKIQIVMATMMPLNTARQFYEEYELARFENITVGKDMDNLLPTYYAINNLPFLAFYDKKGKLIDVFEGSLPVEKVLGKFE